MNFFFKSEQVKTLMTELSLKQCASVYEELSTVHVFYKDFHVL